jgi:hypothetical protein
MAIGGSSSDKPYEVADDVSNPAAYGYEDSLDKTGPAVSTFRRFLDGFKPDARTRLKGSTSDSTVGAKGYDVEAAVEATSQSPLARKLKGRHLQMIAIGGSIGSSIISGRLHILLIRCRNGFVCGIGPGTG